MRNPNGYGSIVKLSGKRRKPFNARITIGFNVERDIEGEKLSVKQVQKSIGTFATRAEALAALAEYSKNPYDLTAATTTLNDLYEMWYKRQTIEKPDSADLYRQAYNHIKLYLDVYKHISEIKHAHMQHVLDEMVTKNMTLVRAIKRIFRECFKLAVANNIVTTDYTTALRATSKHVAKPRNVFSKDEIKRLLASPIIFRGSTTYYDVAIILLFTGMRINELFNIKNVDVDITQRIIHVHGTKTKAAERIVPIHPYIMPTIMRHLNDNKDYLLTTHTGKRITYHNYNNYFWKIYILKNLNMNHTPHELRHTYISLLQRSADINAHDIRLKRIVGHANDCITEHYTHTEIADLVALNDLYKIA